MAQFAAQVYQDQGFGQLDMALSSTDPQQFADRIALVDTVMDVQSETIERLATEQASLTALEDHLSALRADSAEKKKRAEAALARAQGARDAAAGAKADLDQLAATQATQAQAVEGKLAAERAQLAAAQAEQARLKAILKQRALEAKRRAAAAKRAGRRGRGRADAKRRAATGHSWAARAGAAARRWWERVQQRLPQPAHEDRLGQLGVRHALPPDPALLAAALRPDYAIPCGTPVYAAANGTVIMSGYSGSYGNRIVIDHGIVRGEGLATTYNHLSSIRKHSGRVSRGQLIGYSGTTGRSTGCHLHFETLENGGFVDPRTWL